MVEIIIPELDELGAIIKSLEARINALESVAVEAAKLAAAEEEKKRTLPPNPWLAYKQRHKEE